jgi:hypothetical protein
MIVVNDHGHVVCVLTPPFTFKRLRCEAEREITRRKRIYPAQVGKHGRRSNDLLGQLSLMEAIRDLLAELEKSERLL